MPAHPSELPKGWGNFGFCILGHKAEVPRLGLLTHQDTIDGLLTPEKTNLEKKRKQNCSKTTHSLLVWPSGTTFSHFHPIWLFKAELVAPGNLFLRPLDDHFPQAWVIIVTCSLRPGTPTA